MAIVRLTRKNFTSLMADIIDDNKDFSTMLASSFLGGKEKLKESITKNLPEEQAIWINTDYIVAVTDPIKVAETGDIVFQITLAYPTKDGAQIISVKGEEYEDFMNVWIGTREWLPEGTYKVGFGQNCKAEWAKEVGPKMWAEVSEDGLTVTVKKEVPV